jgi:hypothetical protein
MTVHTSYIDWIQSDARIDPVESLEVREDGREADSLVSDVEVSRPIA